MSRISWRDAVRAHAERAWSECLAVTEDLRRRLEEGEGAPDPDLIRFEEDFSRTSLGMVKTVVKALFPDDEDEEDPARLSVPPGG